MGPALNKMENRKIYQKTFIRPHFHSHFHFLISLVFPGTPLVKATKMSKVHIFIFQIFFHNEGLHWQRSYFGLFFCKYPNLKITKISPLSDPPFSIFHKKITKKIKNRISFFLSKILGSFASSKKGMNTFHYEMSMKWIFTFMNFQNVYWHGKAHSALIGSGWRWYFRHILVSVPWCGLVFIHLDKDKKLSLALLGINISFSWCPLSVVDWHIWPNQKQLNVPSLQAKRGSQKVKTSATTTKKTSVKNKLQLFAKWTQRNVSVNQFIAKVFSGM